MSLEGNYINTRLETKKKYNSSNILMDQRYKLTNEIIKPSNNTIINFDGFSNNLNESRSKSSKDLEKEFNEKKNLYNKLDDKKNDIESLNNKNSDHQKIISEMNISNDTLINNKNDNNILTQQNEDISNSISNKKNIELEIDCKDTKASVVTDNKLFDKVINILKRYNLDINRIELENYFLRYNINNKSSKDVLNQMINDIRNKKKKNSF